jgi:hypothetical protein
MPPPPVVTDKHGYVLFDCPICPRKAKLKDQSFYNAWEHRGLEGTLAYMRPNDCRAEVCGFRLKPETPA